MDFIFRLLLLTVVEFAEEFRLVEEGKLEEEEEDVFSPLPPEFRFVDAECSSSSSIVETRAVI